MSRQNRCLPLKKAGFSLSAALRGRVDFGMVRPDLRPSFWAGRASFLSVRRVRGPGVGPSKI
jgi:hypothetical protein